MRKYQALFLSLSLLGVCAIVCYAATFAQNLKDGIPCSNAPLLAVKGDIVIGDGTEYIPLGVGANTFVLTADSTQTTGVKWAAGGGGGVSTASVPLVVTGGTNMTLGTTIAPTTADVLADVVLGTSATTQKGLVLQGKASQTANILEAQTSTGVVTFSVPISTSVVTGTNNNFIGTGAGKATTSGADNTFVGTLAGTANITGIHNTFVGSGAGKAVAGGDKDDTVIGYNAAILMTGGTIGGNTLIGSGVAPSLTGGTNNTIIGKVAAVATASASNTVCIGQGAFCPDGGVVIGQGSGKTGASGTRFTCVGQLAGLVISTGTDNTFFGNGCGSGVSVNSKNSFFGSSCADVISGTANSAFGFQAGRPTITTGSGNAFFGANTDANAGATSNSIIIAGASTAVVQGSTGSIIIKANNTALNSATTNDLIIETGDTGLRRVAANIVMPTDGAGTGAWIQNPAGSARQATNFTNATAAMANTSLSFNVVSGRKYSFHCVLIYSNSTAGEGAQFDFNGGAATSTNFVAAANGAISNTVITALSTVVSQGTVTGNNVTVIDGTFEPSSTSTFVVRGAEVSHATGTLTLLQGSYMVLQDMP